MTKFERESLYNNACVALTCYEDPTGTETDKEEAVRYMYYALCDLVNAFDELTGDDEP